MNLALQRVFVFVLLSLLRCGATEGDSNLCAYRNVRHTPGPGSSSSSSKSSSDEMFPNWGMEVLDDNLTIRCHSNIYCFTLWMSDAHNKSKTSVLKQGCWIGEDNVCKQGACVSSMPPKNNSHFCCCSGDMCNLNFTDGYDPSAHTTTTPFIPIGQPLHDRSYKIKTVIISLVSVFSVALVIIVAYFGYRMYMRPKHPSIESLHAPESPPVQPEFDMDDLKLCNIISKGRYAEVWKGKLEDRDVAVKVYSPHYREYYNNERTLYRLPFMDHEGLVKFYGADERITQEGSAQLMIVMSYVHLGSLNGYLKNNTLDWHTMVGMAYSVAKALSHLHTDIQKADQFKPVLAHRDLNTRNILVRPDLTCIVSDLGFAIATMGSKLIKKGHAEVAEQTSLTDVGTLRYMAPELLDGAVNLRDCEASLKQIDMYALGLVLWEIAMRCVDLYQGAPMPEYTPPFQTEIGSGPTFEEMQLMVVRAKKRPKFPEVWKETNQAVRSLKETIEECWDADAEARLTALCVEERLSDLPNLWAHEIKHRGMTPTLNAMINITETHTTATTDHGVNTTTTTSGTNTGTPSISSSSHLPATTTTTMSEASVPPLTMTNLAIHDSDVTNTSTESQLPNGHVIGGGGEFSRSPSASLTRSWLQDPSVSTGTTDTILPITPGTETTSGATTATFLPPKSSNLVQERNSAVLRPHTGRNPTVERNTHKRSDEELRVSGNTLVSSGYAEQRRGVDRDSLSTQSAPPAEQPSADSPPDYLSDGPETSLVQNDALSHRNPPIPYVQNQVHGNLPPGRPKVANMPSSRGYPRERSSFRERLSRFIRPKELGLKLSSWNIFGGGRRHDYSRADDLEVEDLHQETTNVGGQALLSSSSHRAPPPSSHHAHHASNLNQDGVSSSHQNGIVNSPPGPIHTEVSFLNGAPVTRPTNLVLSAHHSNIREAAGNRELSVCVRAPVRGDRNSEASSTAVVNGEAPRPCSNHELSASVGELAREELNPRMANATAAVNGETSSRPRSNHAVSAKARERDPNPRLSAAVSRAAAESNRRELRSSLGEDDSLKSSESCSRSSSRSMSGEVSGAECSVSSAAATDGHSEEGGGDEVFAGNARRSSSSSLEAVKYPENRLRFAEVGVAKLHLPATSQQPVRRVQGHSKSTSELRQLQRGGRGSDSSDSCWQETELSSLQHRRRPNSLSLKGHNYSPRPSHPGKRSSSKPDVGSCGTAHKAPPPPTGGRHPRNNRAAATIVAEPYSLPRRREATHRSGRAASVEEVHRPSAVVGGGGGGSQSQHASLADPGEKIRRRVKTPVRPSKKSCRLSLYDDRLMSSEVVVATCNGKDVVDDDADDVVVDDDGNAAAVRKSTTGSSRLCQSSLGIGSSVSVLPAGKQRWGEKFGGGERGGVAAMSVHGDCHPSQHPQGASAIMSISDSDIVV